MSTQTRLTLAARGTPEEIAKVHLLFSNATREHSGDTVTDFSLIGDAEGRDAWGWRLPVSDPDIIWDGICTCSLPMKCLDWLATQFPDVAFHVSLTTNGICVRHELLFRNGEMTLQRECRKVFEFSGPNTTPVHHYAFKYQCDDEVDENRVVQTLVAVGVAFVDADLGDQLLVTRLTQAELGGWLQVRFPDVSHRVVNFRPFTVSENAILFDAYEYLVDGDTGVNADIIAVRWSEILHGVTKIERAIALDADELGACAKFIVSKLFADSRFNPPWFARYRRIREAIGKDSCDEYIHEVLPSGRDSLDRPDDWDWFRKWNEDVTAVPVALGDFGPIQTELEHLLNWHSTDRVTSQARCAELQSAIDSPKWLEHPMHRVFGECAATSVTEVSVS